LQLQIPNQEKPKGNAYCSFRSLRLIAKLAHGVREMPVMNIGLATDNTESDFPWFSIVSPDKCLYGNLN
jgi:hypothetical protein